MPEQGAPRDDAIMAPLPEAETVNIAAPAPGLNIVRLPRDIVDQRLEEYLASRPDFLIGIEKIKPGWYVFGEPVNKKLYCKAVSDYVVCRVGGGHKSLATFLDEHWLAVQDRRRKTRLQPESPEMCPGSVGSSDVLAKSSGNYGCGASPKSREASESGIVRPTALGDGWVEKVKDTWIDREAESGISEANGAADEGARFADVP